MDTYTSIQVLRGCAYRIAANRNEKPSSAMTAFSKLFIQPKRDWKRDGAPRIGWKRGELVEVIQAKTRSEAMSELGDVAYYLAQTPLAVTLLLFPREVLKGAVIKFQARAFQQ